MADQNAEQLAIEVRVIDMANAEITRITAQLEALEARFGGLSDRSAAGAQEVQDVLSRTTEQLGAEVAGLAPTIEAGVAIPFEDAQKRAHEALERVTDDAKKAASEAAAAFTDATPTVRTPHPLAEVALRPAGQGVDIPGGDNLTRTITELEQRFAALALSGDRAFGRVAAAAAPAARVIEGVAAQTEAGATALEALAPAAGLSARGLIAIGAASAGIAATGTALGVLVSESFALDRSLGPINARFAEFEQRSAAVRSSVRDLATEFNRAPDEIGRGVSVASVAGAKDETEAIALTRIASEAQLVGIADSTEAAVARVKGVADAYKLSVDEVRGSIAQLFAASKTSGDPFGPFVDQVIRASRHAEAAGFTIDDVIELISRASRKAPLDDAAAGAIRFFQVVGNEADTTHKRLLEAEVDLSRFARESRGSLGIVADIQNKLAGKDDLKLELFGSKSGSAAILGTLSDDAGQASVAVRDVRQAVIEFSEAVERRANESGEKLGRTFEKLKNDVGGVGDVLAGAAGDTIGTSVDIPKAIEPGEAAVKFEASIRDALKAGEVELAGFLAKAGSDSGDRAGREFVRRFDSRIGEVRTRFADAIKLREQQRPLTPPGQKTPIEIDAADAFRVLDFFEKTNAKIREAGGLTKEFAAELQRTPVPEDIRRFFDKDLTDALSLRANDFGEILESGLRGTLPVFREIDGKVAEFAQRFSDFKPVFNFENAVDALPQPSVIQAELQRRLDLALDDIDAVEIPMVAVQQDEAIAAARARIEKLISVAPERGLSPQGQQSFDRDLDAINRRVGARREAADLSVQLAAREAEGLDRLRLENAALELQLQKQISVLARNAEGTKELALARERLAAVRAGNRQREQDATVRTTDTASIDALRSLQGATEARAQAARLAGNVTEADRADVEAIGLKVVVLERTAQAQNRAALEAARGNAEVAAAVDQANLSRIEEARQQGNVLVLTRRIAQAERDRSVAAEIGAAREESLRGLDAELAAIRRNTAEELRSIGLRESSGELKPAEAAELRQVRVDNSDEQQRLAIVEARRDVQDAILDQARGIARYGLDQLEIERQLLGLDAARVGERLKLSGATQDQLDAAARLFDLAEEQSAVDFGIANAQLDPAFRGELELVNAAINRVRVSFDGAGLSAERMALKVEEAVLRARTGAEAAAAGTEAGLERLRRRFADDFGRSLESVTRQWESFEQGGISAIDQIIQHGAHGSEILRQFVKDLAITQLNERALKPFFAEIGKVIIPGEPEAQGAPASDSERIDAILRDALVLPGNTLQTAGDRLIAAANALGAPIALPAGVPVSQEVGGISRFEQEVFPEQAPVPGQENVGASAPTGNTEAAEQSGEIQIDAAKAAGGALSSGAAAAAASMFVGGKAAGGFLSAAASSFFGQISNAFGAILGQGVGGLLGVPLKSGAVVHGEISPRIQRMAHGGIVGGFSIPRDATNVHVPFERAAGGGRYDQRTFLEVAEVPGLKELVAPLKQDGSLQATEKNGGYVVRTPSGAEVPLSLPKSANDSQGVLARAPAGSGQVPDSYQGLAQGPRIPAAAQRDLSRGLVDPALSRGRARPGQPDQDMVLWQRAMSARLNEPYRTGSAGRADRGGDLPSHAGEPARSSAPVFNQPITINMPAIHVEVKGGGANGREIGSQVAEQIAEMAVKGVTEALEKRTRGGNALRDALKSL